MCRCLTGHLNVRGGSDGRAPSAIPGSCESRHRVPRHSLRSWSAWVPGGSCILRATECSGPDSCLRRDGATRPPVPSPAAALQPSSRIYLVRRGREVHQQSVMHSAPRLIFHTLCANQIANCQTFNEWQPVRALQLSCCRDSEGRMQFRLLHHRDAGIPPRRSSMRRLVPRRVPLPENDGLQPDRMTLLPLTIPPDEPERPLAAITATCPRLRSHDREIHRSPPRRGSHSPLFSLSLRR